MTTVCGGDKAPGRYAYIIYGRSQGILLRIRQAGVHLGGDEGRAGSIATQPETGETHFLHKWCHRLAHERAFMTAKTALIRVAQVAVLLLPLGLCALRFSWVHFLATSF